MEMNKGAFQYKNSHVAYVKELFQDIPKAKGQLVSISNGGYSTASWMPAFGYRIYFDKEQGVFNCQVISQKAEMVLGERFREYSVPQVNNTSLDSVTTAILYKEFKMRANVPT